MTRKYTTKLIEAMEEGTINPKILAQSLLGYMSEHEVQVFAHSECYFEGEEEEEDDE